METQIETVRNGISALKDTKEKSKMAKKTDTSASVPVTLSSQAEPLQAEHEDLEVEKIRYGPLRCHHSQDHSLFPYIPFLHI
jgi:hypothetical protein